MAVSTSEFPSRAAFAASGQTAAAKQRGNSCRHRRHPGKGLVIQSRSMSSIALRSIAALVVTVVLVFAGPSWARQDPLPVRKAIDEYLRVQTKGLPGQVMYSIGIIEPNNMLLPCSAIDVGQAPGSRLWGRTNVIVRCIQEGGWSLYVPVQVRVIADYLVTNRPLAQGQILGDGDVLRQQGDLADLPNGVLTDPQQAVGKTAAISVPAGKPLRADMLRQTLAIQQGQSVRVVSRGPGFEVANEGRAINNAAEGQVAQVRLVNGQIVSGIARSGGIVEIRF